MHQNYGHIILTTLERDGRTLTVEPPLTLAVRPTTVGGVYPYWETVLLGNTALVDNPDEMPGSEQQGWYATLTINVVAAQPDDLERHVAAQMWQWWDAYAQVDEAR